MKTIIKTTQLEFDKSDYLIDLVEYRSGLLYVEIVQVIIDSNKEYNSIKINPTVLSDIIRALQRYQVIIRKDKYISDDNQQEIQRRYLKGVSIDDLALQFDQEEELIEMILRNKGIEIVKKNMLKPSFWRGKYKRRKRKSNQ